MSSYCYSDSIDIMSSYCYSDSIDIMSSYCYSDSNIMSSYCYSDNVEIALININRSKYGSNPCLIKSSVIEYMMLQNRKRGCKSLPFMFEIKLFTTTSLKYRMFPELIDAIKKYNGDIFTINDPDNLYIRIILCNYKKLPLLGVIQRITNGIIFYDTITMYNTNNTFDNVMIQLLHEMRKQIFKNIMNEIRSLPDIGYNYINAMEEFNILRN